MLTAYRSALLALTVALMATTTVAAKPVDAGKFYAVLFAGSPPTELRLRIVTVLDDCWVRAETSSASPASFSSYQIWNLCQAIALAPVADQGDVVTVEAPSVLATDEDVLDDLMNRGDDLAPLEKAGKAFRIGVGTKVRIVAVGAEARKVEVLDGPHRGTVGLLMRYP